MGWLRLNASQRRALGDKLMDTANYAIAALVFGLIAQRHFDLPYIAGGTVFYLIFMTVGVILKK